MTSAFPQWVSKQTSNFNYLQIESNPWSECLVTGVGQLNSWSWPSNEWQLESLLRWSFNGQFRIACLAITVTITAAAARAATQTIHFHGESTN